MTNACDRTCEKIIYNLLPTAINENVVLFEVELNHQIFLQELHLNNRLDNIV